MKSIETIAGNIYFDESEKVPAIVSMDFIAFSFFIFQNLLYAECHLLCIFFPQKQIVLRLKDNLLLVLIHTLRLLIEKRVKLK